MPLIDFDSDMFLSDFSLAYESSATHPSSSNEESFSDKNIFPKYQEE